MRWQWPWGQKQKRLPEARKAVQEASKIRQEAEWQLRATRAQTPRVEAAGARLGEQLHNKNHIGRLFESAIRGTK
jgi:hypothetical protein